MLRFTDKEKKKIGEACERHGVGRLDLFGSATGETFDPKFSDLDLVVFFAPRSPQRLFDRYFGLKVELERLFGREVDVFMEGRSETHISRRASTRAEMLPDRTQAILEAVNNDG